MFQKSKSLECFILINHCILLHILLINIMHDKPLLYGNMEPNLSLPSGIPLHLPNFPR